MFTSIENRISSRRARRPLARACAVLAVAAAPVHATDSGDCNGNAVADAADVLPQLRVAATGYVDVGSDATYVVAADFNRDGRIDLAVACPETNDVVVFVVGADGAFNLAGRFSVGRKPFGLTAADLDGDGDPDLASADFSDHTSTVLIGQGDGSFQRGAAYAVGDSPTAVTAADLDGDGHPDLAVCNLRSNDVSVLSGNGDGTFGPAAPYRVGGGPWAIRAGDLNGDGTMDLVTANYFAANASVLLGDGAGGFGDSGDSEEYTAGNGPWDVVIGDFNGDRLPDLAVANFTSNNVSILMGAGNGAFGPATNYRVGLNPYGVAAGDLDGDGVLDLATANYGAGNVTILRGAAAGTFTSLGEFPAAAGAWSLLACDLDGDGDLDVACANAAGENLALLMNESTRHSPDCNTNGVPDECEPDSNGDGVPDDCVRVVAGGADEVPACQVVLTPARCPDVIRLETPSDLGMAVSFGVDAYLDQAGRVEVEVQPPAGTVYPIGQTPVTMRAIDRETQATRRCDFVVEIVGSPHSSTATTGERGSVPLGVLGSVIPLCGAGMWMVTPVSLLGLGLLRSGAVRRARCAARRHDQQAGRRPPPLSR